MANNHSDVGFWTHTKTCAALALAFAALSWAVAAASYSATTDPGGQPGYEALAEVRPNRYGGRILAARLAIEAVVQLPNIHHVVSYAIWEKPWLLALFFGLEVIPVGAWFLLRHVERQLEDPRRRKIR
jgi:hypothetical protein